MRTVYTDRYAVKIWLPLMFGIFVAIGWFLKDKQDHIDLLISAFCFVIAVYATATRFRKRNDKNVKN